jgi:hypothetical protein
MSGSKETLDSQEDAQVMITHKERELRRMRQLKSESLNTPQDKVSRNGSRISVTSSTAETEKDVESTPRYVNNDPDRQPEIEDLKAMAARAQEPGDDAPEPHLGRRQRRNHVQHVHLPAKLLPNQRRKELRGQQSPRARLIRRKMLPNVRQPRRGRLQRKRNLERSLLLCQLGMEEKNRCRKNRRRKPVWLQMGKEKGLMNHRTQKKVCEVLGLQTQSPLS